MQRVEAGISVLGDATLHYWCAWCSKPLLSVTRVDEEFVICAACASAAPSPLLFSSRRKICDALGIQVGTTEQIVEEVKRLRALAAGVLDARKTGDGSCNGDAA